MKQRSLGLALAAIGVAAAAAPAAQAAAHTQRATVLTVDRAHHAVRVIGARHQASTLKVAGAIPASARTGSKVAFVLRKGKATHLRVGGAAATVHVRGKVVRTRSGGLRVKLADGAPLRFGNVVVNLVGFAPGQTVDVAVQVADGGEVNVTITLVTADPSACAAGEGCPIQVEGHVTAIDQNASTFTVDTGVNGGAVEFSATADQLATIAVGDAVEVSGHQTEAGGNVADTVKVEAGGSGVDCDSHHRDLYGVVQTIGVTSFTIGRPAGEGRERSGPIEIQASADILATLTVGELVHAVVHRSGDAVVADSVDQVSLPPASLHVRARILAIGDGSVLIGGTGDGPGPHGGLTLSATADQLSGLAVGDVVNVEAHRTGPEQWTADSLVKVDVPPPPPSVENVDGFLVSVGEASFDVRNGDGTVTVQATPEQLAALAGVVLVHVVAHEDGDALVADSIVAITPPAFNMAGVVASVGDGSFVLDVTNAEGLHHFTVTASADLLADPRIAPGSHIGVHVHLTGPGQFAADAIIG